MGEKTGIEWCNSTWPIVQGCDPVSQGCVNCYAVPLLHRLAWNPNPTISAPLKGLVEWYEPRGGNGFLRFTGKLALREDRLDWPLKWKTPRMIFVPSHGDLFHKDVPDSFIDKVFGTIERADWHTYQILTKRSRRQRDYVNRRYADRAAPAHIWFMVSAEDQANANDRIPDLLMTKAAVRGASLEPLLGPIDLNRIAFGSGDPRHKRDALTGQARMYATGADGNPDMTILTQLENPMSQLDWIIVGGESGNGARPMHPDWARSLRDQCEATGVAFFFKQRGAYTWIDDGDYDSDRIPDLPDNWRERTDDKFICMKADGSRSSGYAGDSSEFLYRVGKKAAGRLLDGKEHNEFPQL